VINSLASRSWEVSLLPTERNFWSKICEHSYQI